MNKQHLVSLSLAALICFALQATTAQAGDIADITIAKDGSEHSLSVDLEALTDGQTLQLSTKAGVPAIVTRNGGELDVEIAGAIHQISIGEVESLWFGERDGEHEVEVIRLGKGEAGEGTDGKEVRVVRLHGAHDEVIEERIEGGEARKVVFVKRHGDEAIDEAELARLIEDAKAGAGSVDADGTRITVERRVTRD